MKPMFALQVSAAVALACAGCASVKTVGPEISDDAAAYGAKIAVAEDFHLADAALETKLAGELTAALKQRGFDTVATQRADLILLPTIGRIDVSGAEEPDATPRRRLLETAFPSGEFSLRRPRASARGNLFRIGLILTAVRRGDYGNPGVALRPVWRIYTSHETSAKSWREAVTPLVFEAARVAAPLAKGRTGNSR